VHLPSRNPGYAHEIRSMYGNMTYAYCTYIIRKNNVCTIRTVADWLASSQRLHYIGAVRYEIVICI